MPDMQEGSGFYGLCVWKRWEVSIGLVSPSPEFLTVSPQVALIWRRAQVPFREKAWRPSPQESWTTQGPLCRGRRCIPVDSLSSGQTERAQLSRRPPPSAGSRCWSLGSSALARRPSLANSHTTFSPNGLGDIKSHQCFIHTGDTVFPWKYNLLKETEPARESVPSPVYPSTDKCAFWFSC